MSPDVTAAIVSAGSSMIVALTALVLNHRGFADLRSEISVRFVALEKRLELIERRLDVMEADVKEFNRITSRQDTDIARLKDKTGLN